jgi:hemolysin activation/secretion protein
MKTHIAAAVAVALPLVAFGQVVGDPSNWQGQSAPRYQTPTLPPPASAYQLPKLPEAGSTLAPVSGGGQIYVSRIEVRGAKVFKPAVVHAIVAPYEKRTVSSGELESLRVELTKLYVDHGYINSGVILPDQESKDGVVVFQAIEGKLSWVRVEGPTKLSPRYIAARVQSRVDEPLNVSDVQSALRSLQQDPNVSRLDARLGPGDTLGDGVLRLNVEDQPRFSIGVGGDNYQSSSIGSDEGKVLLGARNLTGYGDEFKGSVGRSDGNTVGSAVFSLPVSAHDALAQIYYSRGNAVIVQQPFRQLNIKEKVRTYGFSLTVPLLDRLSNRFAVFLGAESARSATELLGTGFSFSPGAQNGISAAAVALAGADWLTRGRSSVTDLRLTYRRGVHALGATINEASSISLLFNPNPTGADGRFGLEQLQFVHIERLNGFAVFSKLNDRAQFLFRASGQYTQKPLLSLEKFPVGGAETVRGFPANLFVRDNGVVATLELQLPAPGYRRDPNLLNLVVAPFIDYGRSWDKANENPGNAIGDTTIARHMASAGLGLLWNPFRGIDTQVYWGRSIANNFGQDDPRLYLPHNLQYHGVYYSINLVARW